MHQLLQAHLMTYTGLPTEFVLLAADPTVMKPMMMEEMTPHQSEGRQWGAVFVGAGGAMTTEKARLLPMLQAALPYGLRLQGSGWGEVEEMRHVWLGSLPR